MSVGEAETCILAIEESRCRQGWSPTLGLSSAGAFPSLPLDLEVEVKQLGKEHKSLYC
jgi:hypothetical protein